MVILYHNSRYYYLHGYQQISLVLFVAYYNLILYLIIKILFVVLSFFSFKYNLVNDCRRIIIKIRLMQDLLDFAHVPRILIINHFVVIVLYMIKLKKYDLNFEHQQ